MRIPAIDELMNHIPDSRTKGSMDEVLSCFYSNNLRSAVVMLYATVVSDIYYKISDLVSIYNDAGANVIKQYVDNEWAIHQTSPTWESEMPKMCHDKNKILKNDGYAHFCHLQSERNLCAHPVITGNNLYRPNFATVQGLITDMLVDVLCKPSFLSKDLVDTFTNDIESASTIFPDDTKLQEYIKLKYLDKIDNEREEYDLFKKLWKFVFKNKDSRSKSNRDANKSILSLLYERYQAYINAEISKEAAYYGASVSIDDSSCLIAFIKFSNEHIGLYDVMPDDFKMRFEQKVRASQSLSALAISLSDDPISHARSVSSEVGSEIAGYLYEYLSSNCGISEAIDFSIEMYGSSVHFDDADDYFDNLIEPKLYKMSEKQLERLIEYSNSNGQIYCRRRASHARYAIKACMEKRNPNFDYSNYTNF